MVWADNKLGTKGPFDGCLVIVNIDNDLFKNHIEEVKKEVDEAHCNGKLVLYLYEKGTESIPEDIDQIEGMDFARLLGFVWDKNTSDLSSNNSDQQNQMLDLARSVLKNEDFLIEIPLVTIIGVFRVGGKECFITYSSKVD